jgi:MATE family multidrug resistance protein
MMDGAGLARAAEKGGRLPLWRAELGAMLRLAAPIVLTQLAWVAIMTTDVALIGRLGANPLAGASLSLMLFFLGYLVCFGVIMATAALTAQAFGARQPRMLRRVVRQGLWVTVLLTVPMVAIFGYTGEILLALGQPADVVPYAEAYMSTLKWALPAAIAFAVLRNFVSALNRPAIALWVMLAGVPVNALLGYALIFGHFGLPRLELVGAGIAASAVNVAMFIGLLAIAVLRRPFARYTILVRFWRPDWQVFGQIFRIGLPIAGTMLLEGGFFIGAVFVAGQFGATVIAAHMIAMQLPHISFMVPMGLAQAATVRVGQAVGRGDAVGAYRAGWIAFGVTLAFMTLMTGVVLLIPHLFASVFMDHDRTDSAAVLALAATFLFYAAFFQMADGVQAVVAGALRGVNDTAVPMALAAVSYWVVGAGAGFGFAYGAGMEGAGLWLGFDCGLACAAVLLTWRLRRLSRLRHIPAVAGG